MEKGREARGEEERRPLCPRCGSDHVLKNGPSHTGKPTFAWKDGRRHFVENPVWTPISAESRARIATMLLERVSWAGSVRVTGVAAHWLPDDVGSAQYAAQPQVADIPV